MNDSENVIGDIILKSKKIIKENYCRYNKDHDFCER